MSKLQGSIISLFAFAITFTAVFWSSGAPLWFDWRVYPEQILLVALALAMAVAFLTRPGSFQYLSIIFAILSLLFGSWLAVPVSSFIRKRVLSSDRSLISVTVGPCTNFRSCTSHNGLEFDCYLGARLFVCPFSSNFLVLYKADQYHRIAY